MDRCDTCAPVSTALALGIYSINPLKRDQPCSSIHSVLTIHLFSTLYSLLFYLLRPASAGRNVVPRCFSREQGGKMADFRPHIWLLFPYDDRDSPYMGVTRITKQPHLTGKINGELEAPSTTLFALFPADSLPSSFMFFLGLPYSASQ
jgi:hypothetical protein